MKISLRRLASTLTLLLSAGLALNTLSFAQAQDTATLTTVYNFTGNNDGYKPESLLLGSDGNFYGTTAQGGLHGYGTIFQFTPAGVLTTIYSFIGGNDGGIPNPGLIRDSAGNLYGTTYQNGANNDGTVFQITPAGRITVLHGFSNSEGNPPAGLVQGVDGKYYGTTTSGEVYVVTSSGGFTSLVNTGYILDSGLIRGSDGNFYGTTAMGNNGHATLFQVKAAGTVTPIGTFSTGYFNENATALVQGSDGSFYGTTAGDGFNDNGNTVFRVAANGTYTLLHQFSNSDNATSAPNSPLVEGSDGNFYGATSSGGTNNDGTVYQITPAGAFTTLYNFSGSDGSGPEQGGDINLQAGAALVLGKDGNLYGTAVGGGTDKSGTIFKLTVTKHPDFFIGQVPLDDGVYYLAFANGDYFGYYEFLSDPNYIYHYDLGFEYVFGAQDGKSGVYFYDFKSKDFFYTSPTFPFPYLYDFNLKSVVYYFPDPKNAGHYNTNGVRYFYVFSTGKIISK